MDESYLELKERSNNEESLERKNGETPAPAPAPAPDIQLPIESCEAQLQRTLEDGFLSFTYRRAAPLIGIPINAMRDIVADHALPPDPTSLAAQYSKLYAGLGIFSKLCRLGAVTLPILSSSTELLQIVQENKSTFNEGYREGVQKGQPETSSPSANSMRNFLIIASEASQGSIQLLAFPIAFIGAQKLASAKNVKEALMGIVFLGAGLTSIMLNSTHNFTSQKVRDQGEYYGALCSSQQGCLGEQKQYLATVPTGINGFVSSIGAVTCGFMYGLTERARVYMRTTNPRDNPDNPAPNNNPINS